MSGDKYAWSVGSPPPPLDPHSAAKHELVRSYVSRYVDILTSDPRQDVLNITLVDGFAGGGEYTYQDGTVPGSPLILLQEIEVAKARIALRKRKEFSSNSNLSIISVRPYGPTSLFVTLEWLRIVTVDMCFQRIGHAEIGSSPT